MEALLLKADSLVQIATILAAMCVYAIVVRSLDGYFARKKQAEAKDDFMPTLVSTLQSHTETLKTLAERLDKRDSRAERINTAILEQLARLGKPLYSNHENDTVRILRLKDEP